MAARAKLSGTAGLLLWALPGALCASAWLLVSFGWEPLPAFLATWSFGLVALALAALRVRALPEIFGLGLGVGVVLLLIALDNRRYGEIPEWTSYVPATEGLGISFGPEGACSDCVDPLPLLIAGAALVATSIAGYALLRRRYR